MSAYTTHETPPRTITIAAISKESARSREFMVGEDNVSVEAYFRQRYNITLQYPQLNLVIEAGPQVSFFSFCFEHPLFIYFAFSNLSFF